jgi:Zn-dependent protease with chaperone function
MRFRQHQDSARRTTWGLVALFALMLVLLVFAINGLMLAIWWMVFPGATVPRLFFETNAGLVLLFVVGGSLVELDRLRSGGGAHVALWAGGREVADPPGDPLERRLRNIVDEMAIASGLPRPGVYVLHREEDAINAFAAGWSNDTAVVAVTRGALERLTRDELQGLVAHEFGHLKHDDLRLQMRLLALVYGLSLVHGYGRHLMDADDDGHRSILGVAMGLAFRAVGSLGLVAGQVLQAAVSRQRELLADASAVQFTRSRDGLGGCLQKIWHQVEERQDRLKKVPDKVLAAMLLHAPSGWLATHPPLPVRLARIFGREVTPLDAPRLALPKDEVSAPLAPLEMSPIPTSLGALVAYAAPMAEDPAPSATVAAPLGQRPKPTPAEREVTGRLSRLHGPAELRATILALLLTPGSTREKRAWRDETKGLSSAEALRDDVKQLGPALRLPWLDELLSRVAKSTLSDRQALMEAARRVMSADGQVRPLDRLHWLAMRHRLGDRPVAELAAGAAPREMESLPAHSLHQVAVYTAFLARLVPDEADAAAGAGWYGSVLSPWFKAVPLPPGNPPDSDAMVHALMEVQALPWMLKPVLLRAWLEAAQNRSPNGRLKDGAADALRITGLLLDCPLPPTLARHYVEPAAP